MRATRRTFVARQKHQNSKIAADFNPLCARGSHPVDKFDGWSRTYSKDHWGEDNFLSFVFSPEQVFAAAVSPDDLENTGGVYFLFYEGRVMYVGESVNILDRLDQHAAKKRWKIEKVATICTPDSWRLEVECAYISTLRPMANQRYWGRRGGMPMLSAWIAALWERPEMYDMVHRHDDPRWLDGEYIGGSAPAPWVPVASM